MTYPLQSPGTSVTVIDESIYASAGEGTVPLIMIGTHSYKTLPSGTGIAPGTLPENANKLYAITSQRELLQTFGNPVFYTKNGTSVHAYELNEFGLHAAYQYLGIANRAYVVRADLDYGQMTASATAPRADAADGTNWLDTSTNTWNVFQYSGSEWIERTLRIVEDAADLAVSGTQEVTGQYPPLSSLGSLGDLAITVTYAKKALYQKIDDAGTLKWVVVGGTPWATEFPSAALIFETFQPATGTTGDILVRITPAGYSPLSAAAHWTIKTYNATTGIWEESLLPIRPLSGESSLSQVVGSTYVSHADTTAVFSLRTYNGNSWTALTHVSSSVEPTSAPSEGTLWYNPTIAVNIKVNDSGSWVSYVTRYPNTDPAGVLLRGAAPTVQSDNTALVDNDLWIDTSDLENFPVMYRRISSAWRKINIADNIDPINGIAFGELADTTAANFAEDMKLFNLTASTNDVKIYTGGVWVNASGFALNGVPFFGRKAQRQMVVRALAASISSNEDIRAETIHFNLVAAPGYIELIDEMVTLNTDMKEVAFIVADTPARLKSTGSELNKFAKVELSGTIGNSEIGVSTFNPYVGMYYPWGLGTNVDGTEIMVPPSTIALRTIAYSDSVSYPWLAPAGFTRGLVNNASTVGYLDSTTSEFKQVILNQGQRDILYQNKINPIAYMPNRGLVVYGQKTRHSLDTALDRINVARLVNYLRYNLDNISKPFIFEPNDTQTRDGIRILFERYLGDLVGLRGLYDYLVVCDDSNNTPERVDRHELWVDVYIQPVQAVEFIYIPMRVLASGDNLDLI